MRIAILSDIHGNSIALDAVFADIAARGDVDEYWVLGDLAAIGPDPVGVLERVARLPNSRVVRGNTDRYVTTGELPPPSPESIRENWSLLPKYREVVASFAWTSGAIGTAGWFDWLAGLPLEERQILPDGTRVHLVHSSPGTDDNPGIRPEMREEEIRPLLANCRADLVCVGHTHLPINVSVGNVRVVNTGSVSNPLTADLRACYVLLDADAAGYRVEHCRVDYDRQAVIAQLERVHHPAREFIARFLRGQKDFVLTRGAGKS